MFMNSFVNSAVSFRNTSSPLGTYFRLSGTVLALSQTLLGIVFDFSCHQLQSVKRNEFATFSKLFLPTSEWHRNYSISNGGRLSFSNLSKSDWKRRS